MKNTVKIYMMMEFIIYHVDHNSRELLVKSRNRRIRTRPSRRRSILMRFESCFGEDFDSKNEDKLGYEFD